MLLAAEALASFAVQTSLIAALVAVVTALITAWVSRRGAADVARVDLFGQQASQLVDAWARIDTLSGQQAAVSSRVDELEMKLRKLGTENAMMRRALKDVDRLMRSHFGSDAGLDMERYGLDPSILDD